MTRFGLACAVIACLSPAVAAAKVTVIVPQAEAQVAADTASAFPVYFTNEGDSAEAFAPPPSLTVRSLSDGTLRMVPADLIDGGGADGGGSAELAPGSFRKAFYRLRQSASGAGTLADAQPAPEVPSAAPVEPVNATTERESGGSFLDNLRPYRPIYALYGASPSNAKLQLSFKYQFFDEDELGHESDRWLSGLHFGFTQTLFWDLSKSSAPFRDIIFSPELMYLVQTSRAATPGRAAVGLQFGVRHESNGKAGLDSRSLNIAYIEPSATFALGDDWTLTAAPRAWFYVGDQDGNGDIERFRGYSGLALGIGRTDGIYLAADLRGFLGSGRATGQFDLSYPLNRIVGSLNLYLHSQLFTGYGESLLDYDRKKTAVRVGVSIVR